MRWWLILSHPGDDSRAIHAQRPAASLPMQAAVRGMTGWKRSLGFGRGWGGWEWVGGMKSYRFGGSPIIINHPTLRFGLSHWASTGRPEAQGGVAQIGRKEWNARR